MDSNAVEIKYIFIACHAEALFLIEVELIINKDAKFVIYLIAIFISIARAIEIQK